MGRQAGFTLIELMITVIIIGVLSAVAYPSYMDSVYKARRTDGHATLYSLAQKLERCKTSTFTYKDCITDDVTSSEGYYKASVSDDTSTTFTLIATPQSPQDQDECGQLQITHAGDMLAKGTLTSNAWSDDVDACC